MVGELNERAAARKEYSRRRAAADGVDFINSRNAHYNKKLERRAGGPGGAGAAWFGGGGGLGGAVALNRGARPARRARGLPATPSPSTTLNPPPHPPAPRAFGSYVQDTKAALERGSAL